jgi:hypothetical protein
LKHLLLLIKLLPFYNKVLGADHPNTINSRSCTASILQAQGKLEEALIIRNEVLQARRRVLGEDHTKQIVY